jgi:magnesium chelatase family protein
MGGGARAKPGEVSLAHRGILFLDEMPEFSRQALEALRQPVETGEAVIARAAAHVTYPARFQLIAAMNPCRCGWLGDASRECRKAPRCGEDYLGKLSGPLIDRIDLWVPVQPVSPADMLNASSSETTATVAERVARARDRQNNRNDGIRNSEIKAELCIIHDNAKSLVGEIARSFRLSARGFTRLLRVARTIADLADSDLIHETHVSEAAAYRQRLH